MNEINEIGSRLRELREASDYTVERLSAELKVDPEAVSYTHLDVYKRQGLRNDEIRPQGHRA